MATPTDVPQGFRIDIEVGSLDEAERFYGTLLNLQGRRAPGARIYFDCGPLTLQVVDVTTEGREVHRLPSHGFGESAPHRRPCSCSTWWRREPPRVPRSIRRAW